MSFNIIPQEKITEIRRRENITLLHNWCCLILGILVVLNLFIWTYNRHFSKEFAYLSTVPAQTLAQDVKKMNNQLAQLDNALSGTIPWLSVFYGLNRSVPAGININRLEADRKTGLLVLAGKANDREDLLTLEQNLRGLYFIKGVSLPPESLFQKDNLNFQITATLDASKFQ